LSFQKQFLPTENAIYGFLAHTPGGVKKRWYGGKTGDKNKVDPSSVTRSLSENPILDLTTLKESGTVGKSQPTQPSSSVCSAHGGTRVKVFPGEAPLRGIPFLCRGGVYPLPLLVLLGVLVEPVFGKKTFPTGTCVSFEFINEQFFL
jgi:hypothetical protein